MKNKKKYRCTVCGYLSPIWVGKCSQCDSWNSFVEEISLTKKDKIEINNNPVQFNDIQELPQAAIKFSNDELNDFFGEGIIYGSVILLAGEPGIGKSSFLYLMAQNLTEKKILYFSGEETLFQLKKRGERLNIKNNSFYLSNNNDIDQIIEICKKEKPDVFFIDSIQTVKKTDGDNISIQGSINQIKVCTEQLVEFSKSNNISVIIIGHITKSGEIAGPKVIEHMVDVVVYFENDIKNNFRVLRSTKNRFGNIDNILFFNMLDKGLKIINNNSELVSSSNFYKDSVGKCKSIIIEGSRLLFVEVESLVTPSVFVNPRRFVEGIDSSRLNRIIAILNKHLNENLNNYDVYINISNGIKVKDVAVDLAVAISIYSSKNNIKINGKSCFIGELSLSGDILNVKKIESRVSELQKYGIEEIFIPKHQKQVEKSEECIMIDNIISIKNYLNYEKK